MASVVATVRRKVLDVFGADAFYWWDRAYVVDWAVMCALWVVAWVVKEFPPFEREVDPNDPAISHQHHKNTIGGDLNIMIAVFVPVAVVVAAGTLRVSAMEIHHGLLSLLAGSGLNEIITEFLKNRVGRLRPDFLTRCKWSNDLKACTGKANDIMEGRRSFPSGHSSTAFAGMAFLSLFLAGLMYTWTFGQSAPARNLLSTRLGRICVTLAPVAYATWVAVSRLEDYRHHKEDVIVGSLLGTLSATTAYLVYWPNPFTLDLTASARSTTRARVVYGQNSARSANHEYEYELAGAGDASV
ncbi:lipid phosphate phosphatase [Phanerochaete sordida]|uniref:Lipid phosphate phosphatase n=1 Tax=Phanerochaete sordida TaxID=48140 RepID=A0A9P3LK84_9APHY|nr:lipid phosphate phosphatase [Phanerochaete sordida]